jgi:hypothetical protein
VLEVSILSIHLNFLFQALAQSKISLKFTCLLFFQEFVKELRMRPLNRHYFVIQTNPGEQFYLFTSLAAWLIRKSGRQFDPPQEFDDPNSTIANILDNVRQMGVAIGMYPYVYMCVYSSLQPVPSITEVKQHTSC